MKSSYLLLLILVAFVGIFVSVNIAESYWVEENTAAGEGTTFADGTTQLGTDYTNTTIFDDKPEYIEENTSLRLKWNYDFNTTYNDTQPAKLKIIVYNINFAEYVNITIYNYNTGEWEYLNQTTTKNTDENLTTTLSWQDKNLSHYINTTNGQIKILFEDINESGNQNALTIYYLAINVTVSPLYADWYNLIDFNTGAEVADGTNFTRDDTLNVSAHWNASNLIGAVVVVNDSNTGLQREFNITGSFAGNYTNYTLNLSNVTEFPLGGNVSVKIRVNDSFYQENTTNITHWFYLWSNATVSNISINESANGSSTTIANGSTFLVLCEVVDNHSSTAITGYNVSFYFSGVYNGSNTTNSTGWAVYNYTDNSTGAGSYIISCNITDQSDIYYGPSVENASLNLSVIEDPYSPVISDVQLKQQDLITNKTNLYTNFTVLANITDNLTRIVSATVTITYPNNTVVNGSMTQYSGDIWNFTFFEDETGTALNQTGSYNISVTAFDIVGNGNQSENSTFTVYDTYTVNMTDYYENITYNRGENLTLSVLDVNNLTVYNVNWSTVNITRFGQAETNLTNESGNVNTFFIYAINASDPVGNWTLLANISNNNTGNRTFYFNVTNELNINLAEEYTPGPYDVLGGNVKIYINNTRDGSLPYTVDVNLTCDSSVYVLNKSGEVYSNSSISCRSPNAYSTNFDVVVNVSDSTNNNTGSRIITLTTSSAPPTDRVTGGGGGLPTPPEECNCTEWMDVGCGPTGGCASGEMYQTRTCTPAGCENESQCIPHTVCIEVEKGFNFTVDRTDVEVNRGENITVMGTAQNTGNISLVINLSIESILVVFALESFNLSEAPSSLDIPIIIHTTLTQELGVYFVTISAATYGIESNKTVKVNVKESPLIEKLDELETELNDLKESIRDYSDAGVYVQDLEELAGRIEELLQGANGSIQKDSLFELQSQLGMAVENINNANARLSVLGIQRFIFENKWWIISGVVIIIILSYLSTEILLPYYRLSRDIKRLRIKEKTQVQGRIATEKDYFMGKMTEDAFNKLLMEKQTKILDTRGAVRERMKERTELVKAKLTLGAVKNWFKSGLRILKKLKPYKPKK